MILELREESERLEEEGKNVMKQCKENVVFTWTQTNRSKLKIQKICASSHCFVRLSVRQALKIINLIFKSFRDFLIVFFA